MLAKKHKLILVKGFFNFILGSILIQTLWAAQEAAPSKFALPRGSNVFIRNPLGDIEVTGWNQDTIEAIADSNEGRNPSAVKINTAAGGNGDVTIQPDSSKVKGEVTLIVHLPRYALLKNVEGTSGSISIKDVDSPVKVSCNSGDISISNTKGAAASSNSGEILISNAVGPVTASANSGDIHIQQTGPVEARSQSGDISIQKAAGNVILLTISGDMTTLDIQGDLTVKTSSGDLKAEKVSGRINANLVSSDAELRRVGQDIQVATVSGDVRLECAEGRAELSSTSGEISLSNVRGDVDARSASGNIQYSGAIRAEGRYRLKSNSGSIEMKIPENSPGFTATLNSYSGSAETDFPLTLEPGLQRGSISNRLTGKFGDGRAQITLDSFSEGVKLSKGSAGTFKTCAQ